MDALGWSLDFSQGESFKALNEFSHRPDEPIPEFTVHDRSHSFQILFIDLAWRTSDANNIKLCSGSLDLIGCGYRTWTSV